jgi:hypothetical protein
VCFDTDSDSDKDSEVVGHKLRRVGIRGLQGREEVQTTLSRIHAVSSSNCIDTAKDHPRIRVGVDSGPEWDRDGEGPLTPALSPRCGARESRVRGSTAPMDGCRSTRCPAGTLLGHDQPLGGARECGIESSSSLASVKSGRPFNDDDDYDYGRRGRRVRGWEMERGEGRRSEGRERRTWRGGP